MALVARRADAVQQWAQAQGIPAEAFSVFPADVRDVSAITSAGRACITQLGLPEVVIANAGISVGMDTADYADLEVMRATFETNNLGLAATFQPFVAAMCQRGSGRLVGIASVAGIRGLPGHGAYCASKAAVISYCESLRGECRAAGVKVVTIAPGYIDTPLTRGNRYSMPFLMTADAFADRAFRHIAAGVR
ncbi:MAG: short-chain dehydrogenase, partial [Burkholderiales bacterium PBB5]